MLIVEQVTYQYDDLVALRNISLAVNDGEILCLLGPSGCGKTTLLRVVAGLETGYKGQIMRNDADLRNIPVNKRGFGLMFQDFALFPHMTVAQNIAYGLKRQNLEKADIEQRVQDILNRVGLSGYGKRDVNQLSGGQKQRVALARSLAPNPQLLMLDEPLGSLDALLRDQLSIELRDIIKSVGLTAIYVTHDQKEAYAIADRIAVMNMGQIEQVDTPQDLFYQPRTEFVARFLGLSNIFNMQKQPLLQKLTPMTNDAQSATKLLIHPSGIYLAPQSNRDYVEIAGVIDQKIFRGEYFEVNLRIADDLILNTTLQRSDAAVGDRVSVFIDPLYVVPLES